MSSDKREKFCCSSQLRFFVKTVPNVPTTPCTIAVVTEKVVTVMNVLQQWWYNPQSGHNSSLELNGEWREVPTVFAEGLS